MKVSQTQGTHFKVIQVPLKSSFRQACGLIKDQQTSSVKTKMMNISGFADQSLSTAQFSFVAPKQP